jgi:hypothetical protein
MKKYMNLVDYFNGDNIYSNLNEDKWIEFCIKHKYPILIKKSVEHNMIKLLCYILNNDKESVSKFVKIKKLYKYLYLNDIIIIYNTVKTDSFLKIYDDIFHLFFYKNKIDIVKYLFENKYTNFTSEYLASKLSANNTKEMYDYFIN